MWRKSSRDEHTPEEGGLQAFCLYCVPEGGGMCRNIFLMWNKEKRRFPFPTLDEGCGIC